MKKIVLAVLLSFLLSASSSGRPPELKEIGGDIINGQCQNIKRVDTPESVSPDKSRNTLLKEKDIKAWETKTLTLGTEDLQCKMVRGNVESRVFHQPGCRHFNCKNCTKAFPDRHDALKAGFIPCEICNP